MKRFLIILGLFGALLSPSWAVDSWTPVGNIAYTILSTDTRIVPVAAISANRTWTLPSAGATCIGQTCGGSVLEIQDALGNVGGVNSCIVIAPASNETINGSSSSLTLCSTFGRMILYPINGSAWQAQILGPGQFQGTVTNDNAQAGMVGEIITSGLCPGSATTTTVTTAVASPGVVGWTTHGFTGACPVVFTNSGGALPTGITSGTTYYIIPSSITTSTFQIATTVANALAGTAINFTGSSTGTQTGTAGVSLSTNTPATVTGLALTAGDWDCRATISRTLNSSTSVTVLKSSINAAATTIGSQGTNDTTILQTAANVMGALGEDQKIGPTRISLSATTNEFLVMSDTFTVSTDIGFGSFACRRVR